MREATASDARGAHLLLIEARYYEHIADALLTGAQAALDEAGATYDVVTVPGALEIPPALSLAIAAGAIRTAGAPPGDGRVRYDGVLALGCVIRGETSHYDVVVNEANRGVMDLATRHAIPVGNAILTVENEAQALVRARGGQNVEGSAKGKGADAASACLALIGFAHRLAPGGARA